MPAARRLAAAIAVGALGLAALAACTDDPEPEPRTGATGNGSGATYVALGDSYTAGPMLPGKQSKDGCVRSLDRNYPHLVADRMTDLELDDVSCGGATTDNMTTSQFTSVDSRPPQLDALGADTEVVTLGVGGNDDGIFGILIATCTQLAASDPSGSPCADQAAASGTPLSDTEAKLQASIEDVVGEIAKRSPDADVLLVGYPDIVPSTGSCDELPLATGDYDFGRQIVALLNDALSGAADTTGSTYVDVAAATQGHDICSADPWVAGAVPEKPAAPFHPYEAEQQAVADLVVQALKG